MKNDKALQFQPGTTIKASHGFGYLGRHATTETLTNLHLMTDIRPLRVL